MHLTMDFVTKLLLIAEKDMILVIYDRLSKMTCFVIITRNISKRVSKVVQR